MIGDFNDLLSIEDKAGGALTSKSLMIEFKEALEDCNLIDLLLYGFGYTRTGTRGGELIQDKLD